MNEDVNRNRKLFWIDESILRWFGYVERMERDRIAKRVYVVQWVGDRRDGLIP